MTASGLDGVTVDGTNDDLNDPIGYALRVCGYSVSDISGVADTDLAGVSSDDYDKFLDVAEHRTLVTILNNYDDVDISIGSRNERFSQIADRLGKRIESMERRLENVYGIGAGSLEAGHIVLDFAEHKLETPINESDV